MATGPKIYEFMVSLNEIQPKIWRRIQVPDTYNFYELHLVIAAVMGWADCDHLHQFDVKNPTTGANISIGTPSSDYGFEGVISEDSAKIAEYFVAVNHKAFYEYDFVDGWKHEIVLERIMAPESDVFYPFFVAGERACPPEDCGGVWSYAELLKILADPKHVKYEEKMEWLYENGHDDFDPDDFYCDYDFFEDLPHYMYFIICSCCSE